MSCGLPVVGTEVGGIPEIISGDAVGFLTQRDPVAMARRIQEAMTKNWDPEAIIRYAHRFSWESVAASLHVIFERVVSSSALREADTARPIATLR
jgi:glycosyltransferase involved in cell wall biosynthesis